MLPDTRVDKSTDPGRLSARGRGTPPCCHALVRASSAVTSCSCGGRGVWGLLAAFRSAGGSPSATGASTHVLRLPEHFVPSPTAWNILTHYVSTAVFALASTAVAAIWLALDRRGTSHAVAYVWAFVIARLCWPSS
jgi:hypothetical protein